ncbi:hypothetical protein [Kitasatospora sp. NPDC050543]|uniref:hypothetical protein n=1 Tax=Kitasatospora sp. NPDC050543 TaxID=3364054 RepID=UPI0037A20561
MRARFTRPQSADTSVPATPPGPADVSPLRRLRRVTGRLGGASGAGDGSGDGKEQRAARSGPSKLYRAGPHFVIAPTGADPAGPDGPWQLAGALSLLRPAPDALIVIAAAADAAPVLRARLPELARAAVGRGATVLLLAASGLAAVQPDGRRVAEQVAGRAGLPVIAPDGTVSIEPDGTLLVTGADGAEPASWWRCAPAGTAERLGPTWPVPTPAPVSAPASVPLPVAAPAPASTPEPELTAPAQVIPTAPPEPSPDAHDTSPSAAPPAPEAPPAAPATPVTTRATSEPVPVLSGEPFGRGGPLAAWIPAGCWVRAPGAPVGLRAAAIDDAAAAPGTFVLVLGHPAEPLVSVDHLATAVRRWAPATASLLLSAPWAAPAALTGLACGLAVELGREVRAAFGLPLPTADGHSARILDAEGTPTWEPLLVELTASAERRRVVASSWRSRPDGWTACGPALFEALPGWLLEAVPAGLWLRPSGAPTDLAPRLRTADPARPLLIVGEQGQPVPEDVWQSLGELLRGMPEFGPARPGLLVAGSTGPESGAIARFVARMNGLEWTDPEPPAPAPAVPATPAPVPLPSPDPAPAPAGDPAPPAGEAAPPSPRPQADEQPRRLPVPPVPPTAPTAPTAEAPAPTAVAVAPAATPRAATEPGRAEPPPAEPPLAGPTPAGPAPAHRPDLPHAPALPSWKSTP